jgi:hypothetical protein
MIYRKRGRVLRWENGIVVRVSESGLARESGALFECRPAPFDEPEQRGGEELDERSFASTASAIAKSIDSVDGVAIERLIVTHGVAEHAYGDRRWRDSARRVHVSVVRGRMRALLDLGAFDDGAIVNVARVLARSGAAARPAPPRMRMAPNVVAALLPSLAAIAPRAEVRLVQTAGGIDGRGGSVVEAESVWPNWYRPSYRVRPVRAPLNLRIECLVTDVDRSLPVAVALLGPVDLQALPLLIDDGERPFPATLRLGRIEAVATAKEWYPYGAGSFGAEMML